MRRLLVARSGLLLVVPCESADLALSGASYHGGSNRFAETPAARSADLSTRNPMRRCSTPTSRAELVGLSLGEKIRVVMSTRGGGRRHASTRETNQSTIENRSPVSA
jgi:hypothetical protein